MTISWDEQLHSCFDLFSSSIRVVFRLSLFWLEKHANQDSSCGETKKRTKIEEDRRRRECKCVPTNMHTPRSLVKSVYTEKGKRIMAKGQRLKYCLCREMRDNGGREGRCKEWGGEVKVEKKKKEKNK